MAHPVLYSFRRCPYAMRARLAIAVSRQPCILREVVLRDKPSELLEASPKGTVPVLVLPDGRVIDESLDIMLWALRCNDPEGWLKPEAESDAVMMERIQCNDGVFKQHLDRYKYPNRFELTSGQPDRDAGAQVLQQLDDCLRERAWLGGSRRSLADMAIAPFVRQYANTDKQWFDQQAWAGLHRWLDAFLGDALFMSVMEKYPQWTAGQPETVFAPCA